MEHLQEPERLSLEKFSREFEAWGREMLIPLRDILQMKEDFACMYLKNEIQFGEAQAERQLHMMFLFQKAQFGSTPLLKGTQSLQQRWAEKEQED